MFNSIENFKEDYVIQLIQPLIDLNIPMICKMIETSIYSINDDGRFEYQEYFTHSRFHEYLEAKKLPINAENIRFLKSFPQPVIPFYELLETLKVVSNTFEELGTIPLVGIEGTLRLPQNAWTLIQINIPLIYQRLNQLSRSHILIHQLLQPLLNPTKELLVQTQASAIGASEHLNQLYTSNQDSLSLMLPKQEGGLAVMTKLVILMPHFLKELTQYIERGDTKINFDPNSSEIIELENIYVTALHNITDPNQTTIQGLIKLIEVLPKTISNILKESMPLAEASAEKLIQLKNQLEKQFFQIQASLEKIEENLGLKKDTLITPYKQNKEFLIDTLNQTIPIFQKLPGQLAPYAKLTNFISEISLVPNLDDIKNTPKSAARIVRQATKAIQNTLIDPKISSVAKPIEKKDISLNLLQLERLKRFKKINVFQKNRYEAFIEFFKVLHNAKKYPVSQNIQAFENFLISTINGRYYSMVKTIQDLSEQQKTSLKTCYPYIQEFFQVESPHLDAAIVQCLEAKDGDGHVYMPNQSSDAHYVMRLLFMAGIFQYLGTYCIQSDFNWISGAMMFLYITYLYTYPLSNQLDVILKHQKTIEIGIGQNQTHEDRQIETIKERFKEEIPALNITEFSQTITIPELIPTIQKPYDSAFTLLKKNRPSQNISDFLQNSLYPLLKKTLNKQKLKQLFSDENQPIEHLPFAFSYKDDELIQSYKQLINAFYHLTLTLEELEKVDEHVYNEDNSIILQSWNVVSILLPILTSGLQTINEIQNSLKNPRLVEAKEECLACINDVKSIINVRYPITRLSNPINAAQEEHFDAYQSWLTSQETYQRKIHKKILPIENQIPQNPPTKITPTDNKAKSLTVKDLVDTSTKSLIIIDSLHQKLFDKKSDPSIQELEDKSIVTSEEFIKELRCLIKVHIHRGEKRKGRDSIHYITSFVIDKNSISNLFDTFSKSKPLDTLNFIDGFVQVCEELYLSHQEATLTSILRIYDLLSYHLLTMADDFEHSHLKPGVISIPLQEKINDAFEALIERIAPEKLFEFWTSKKVFEARINYQDAHIEKALQDLEELKKSQSKLKIQIQRRFKHLKSILEDFNPDSIKTLKESQEFKFFLRNYTYLQPILFKINPKFDQIYFLASIKNHRPDQFVGALKDILEHEKEINAFFHSQIKHQKTEILEYRKSRKNIISIEKGIQNQRIINHAIQQIIKQQYQIELGSYHHYYAEKLIKTFWKNRKDQIHSNLFLQWPNLSNSKIFQDEITEALEIVGQKKPLPTIFSILKIENLFTTKLENEIKLSYRTKSNPPSKYQFVFEKNQKLTDVNKIYITKGYHFVITERLPEDEALEYSRIYYNNNNGRFVFKSINGDTIQGEVSKEERSNKNDDIKNFFFSTFNLSDDHLFYRTQKNQVLEPVPQEFIDENKIDLQDPKLLKTLNDYLREFLRFSDSKSYTDEERPCLKQKISYLQTELSKAKKENILEKITDSLEDEESQTKLKRLKYIMKYNYHRATLQFRSKVKFFNQIMFIDDQLDKARRVNNVKIYEDLQKNIRNNEVSAEQRFYQFSINFKAKKRFLGEENQYLDVLAKKIWRGAIIIQNLEFLKNRFSPDDQKKIQELMQILKNDHIPFIPLDKRLEDFFDRISQDEYLELFRKPQSIFDKILRIFSISSAQEQFLQNLRKQNRLLDTCMTLSEIGSSDTQELKTILHNTAEDPIPNKNQAERLKLFSKELNSSLLSSKMKQRLTECLPKEPTIELQTLIATKQAQFLKDLVRLKSIYTTEELQTKIEAVTNNSQNYRQYKKALKELDTYLKINPPRNWSSFFTHMVGQKTDADIVIEKVMQKVNFFKQAEELKSSKGKTSHL